MSQLPKGWVNTKFTDYLDVNGGTQPPKKEFLFEPTSGYVRLLQIRDFGKKPVPTYVPITSKLRLCEEDDVLIGRYGASLGRICTGMDGAYNVALAKVAVPSLLDKGFVRYYLESEEFQQPLRLLSRSAQNGFNKKDLSEFDFSIAPLAEQQRIVEKLDEVLAQVDTIKARLDGIPAIIKRFRQSVLAAAVSGKLTEEWREVTSVDVSQDLISLQEEEGAYLARKLKDEKSKILKEKLKLRSQEVTSTHQSVPLGWIEVPFFEACLLNRGFDLPTAKRVDGDYPILSAGGLIGYHNEYKVEGPVITVGRSGSVGQVFMTEHDAWPLNTALYAKDIGYNEPKFVFLLLKFLNLASFASSTAVPTLNRNEFILEPVLLPSKKEQNEIVRLVEQYFAFADTIEAQVKKAQARVDNLTQSILAKAFRGELVPQDPEDEPADKLLERIAEARKEAEALAKAAKKAEAAKKRAAKKAASA